MSEKDYVSGYKQAYLFMLQTCLKALGYDEKEPEVIKAAWVQEREETVITLRGLCGEIGDNDWPDELHLRDVIQKHLIDYVFDFDSEETE